MNSAVGEARSPRLHADATSAETPSDRATEKDNDLKEKEMGLFKAFQEGKSEEGLRTRVTGQEAITQNHLTTPATGLTRDVFAPA
jgi:hypothetical protein